MNLKKSPGISTIRPKAATISTGRKTSPSFCRAWPMTPHQNQVDDLIRHRLRDMFKASRKTCYEDVLPLPKLEDVADRIRRGRVLLVVSPDSKIPPEEVQKFFEGLSQKNNLCVLTGDKTAMGSVEKAARQFLPPRRRTAGFPRDTRNGRIWNVNSRAMNRISTPPSSTFSIRCSFRFSVPANRPSLHSKALDMTRDATKPFNGEEQIEKTLTANPLKLYLDVEKEFDAIRDKAQDLLWPENLDEARWSDVVDRYAEQAGMYVAAAERTGHPQIHRLQSRIVGRPRQWIRYQETEEKTHLRPNHRRVRA